MNELTAISPIDGRYRNKTDKASLYFSEYALIKYRIFVEIEYFIKLCEIPLPQLKEMKCNKADDLRKIYEDFSIEDAARVKEIEKTTNHDVKSVEYFIKEKFDEMGLSACKEFIHFGLTSQDINNTAVPASLQDFTLKEYLPLINELIVKLNDLSDEWTDIPMLARTHGQPASPTRLGKEIKVFSERIEKQLNLLRMTPFSAKFGGATGNFNAHYVAYPDVDWHDFANNFLMESLGLQRSNPTTQIEHYDNMAALFDAFSRINNIILDLNRDMWTYISMEYFKQRIIQGEVGSSAMPHKVNPIDFENSEGNIGIANAVFKHLSAKLPISRLQRDLTDSTVTRNVGVPLAHSMISIKSTLKGLNKIVVNKDKIKEDLEENTVVIAEAVQTILRRESYPNPYEELKKLTRTGKKITQEVFIDFIENLKVSEEVKAELKQITPFNYIGR